MINTKGLRIFYKSADFGNVWHRIVNNIQIQKFDRLNNVSEFYKLPNTLRDKITTEVDEINDYKIFINEQYFNSSYAILHTNENEKWIAIFQEKGLSINIPALVISTFISGLFYIWKFSNRQEQKYNNSYRTSNNSNDIISYVKDTLFQMNLIFIPLTFAFYLAGKWFLPYESKYNELVKACMLKKLKTLTN